MFTPAVLVYVHQYRVFYTIIMGKLQSDLPAPNSNQIPCDIPKLQQAPRSSAPSVPRHLALGVEERENLQKHLDLVGVDKYRFEHTAKDQGK